MKTRLLGVLFIGITCLFLLQSVSSGRARRDPGEKPTSRGPATCGKSA